MKRRHTGVRSGDLAAYAREPEFSLVLGGPLYQLFLRLRLVRPPLQLLYGRLVVIPLLAWLPLLVLSLLDGTATGGTALPFLLDVGVYARFLVAMPVLLLAEPVVHFRLRNLIRQFHERRLVPPDAEDLFADDLRSAMKLRDAMWMELGLLAIAVIAGPTSMAEALRALHTSAWHSDIVDGQLMLTRAGWWFLHVSAPMFQFLVLRWYFRLLLWWRLLWQLSRLPLALKPAHADRAGGLGFLGDSAVAFAPVLFAQTALVSGFIGDRILAAQRHAHEFLVEIVTLVVLLILAVVGPLLFFSRKMERARRAGVRRYGALASEHADGFEDKWLGPTRTKESLVGSPDVSSLADLSASVDVVRQMRPIPFDLRVLVQLVVATLLPFTPLLFTEITFRDAVTRVLKMLI